MEAAATGNASATAVAGVVRGHDAVQRVDGKLGGGAPMSSTHVETPTGAVARPSDLRSGAWSETALRVLRERYLAKDSKGVHEAPEDMCWRVAYAIAQAEKRWGANAETVESWARQYYNVMVDTLFLPNSPTLMNAGRGSGLQYSACYVLPVGDSMEEIFDAVISRKEKEYAEFRAKVTDWELDRYLPL